MSNSRRSIQKFILLAAMIALLTMSCSILTISSSNNRLPTTTSIPMEPNQPVHIIQPTAAAKQPILTSNEEAILVDLYKRASPSVVNIVTYTSQSGSIVQDGQGSGFVYDSGGYILTNAHVVHGSNELEVVFFDNTILTGNVVGEDLNSDLAVIQVDRLPQEIQPLPLADIDQVAVGQTAVAIGNPFGLGGTLTRGIISAMGRTIPALTVFSIPQAIQTDAPINPGNSGGPLLNLQGEVIGVNAQIETGSGSRVNSGVGFAIPVSIVKRVVPDLIKQGKHNWSWLGVSGGNVNPTLVKAMNLPVDRGAYISQVVSGGPADKAGLVGSKRNVEVGGRLAETGGDIITAIDGLPVSSFDDILIYIALQTSPGQTVKLTVLRGGKTLDIPLILELRPEETRN